MKLNWIKIRTQFWWFIIFYCAIFTSVLIVNVIFSGHNPVSITKGNLIGPAIGGTLFILFSRMKKTQRPTA